VVSTWAFLAAKPQTLVSIDVVRSDNIYEALDCAQNNNINMVFLEQNTIAPDFVIEPTDLLFIDTLHNYAQLKEELARHGNQSRRWIIFHDTETFGHADEVPENPPNNWTPKGLVPAVDEFIRANPHWQVVNHFPYCNGLTVLKRTDLPQ
jgi:hypothetical protein